jgi:prepilin-type N-terminal cleavage/methylation domain-containing protein
MLRNEDGTPRTGSAAGFTLIEITIAILILTVAVLGIASSTGKLIAPTLSAEADFQALQAVEDRLSRIRMEPRYGKLDSLFAGTQTGLPGMTGYTRTTTVTRTRTTLTGGKVLDYTTLVVTVTGPRLKAPLSRKLVVAAP